METLGKIFEKFRPATEWSWLSISFVSFSSMAAMLVGARHVYQLRQKQWDHQVRCKEQEEKDREIRRIQLELQALRFPQLYELARLSAERRLARKKVHLYFDSNDEFILDEQYYSMASQDETTASLLQHSVLVNFESEQQQIEGTHKITPSIFQGTSGDKTENAMCFIENLDKTQLYKQQDGYGSTKKNAATTVQDMLNEAADGDTAASRSADNDRLTLVSGSSNDDMAEMNKAASEVILNISPQKFEKPKDQLFIDFFSMYTKRFVKDKRKQQRRTKQQQSTPKSNNQYVSYKSIEDEDF